MKKIYIRDSTIEGKGIIAAENIKKGEVIQYIKGKERVLQIKSKADSLSYPNWIGVGKNRWIEVEYPIQYLNHSCKPNAGIKGRVTIVALKNIRKDEEITIDYSTTECDVLWEMACACGAGGCRRTIRSIQFLPYKQFKSYLPYIPTYFRDVYLGLKGKLLPVQGNSM